MSAFRSATCLQGLENRWAEGFVRLIKEQVGTGVRAFKEQVGRGVRAFN